MQRGVGTTGSKSKELAPQADILCFFALNDSSTSRNVRRKHCGRAALDSSTSVPDKRTGPWVHAHILEQCLVLGAAGKPQPCMNA
eukprot:364714-Chlamydomonas_euryale.AAC.2